MVASLVTPVSASVVNWQTEASAGTTTFNERAPAPRKTVLSQLIVQAVFVSKLQSPSVVFPPTVPGTWFSKPSM